MPDQRPREQTPASLGYTFPAEWEKHAATWISWPRPEGISFPGTYHSVPESLVRIIREIVPRERVEINVPNENYEFIVRQFLDEYGCPDRKVGFHHIQTNESWCRDHGPAFVVKRGARRGAKPQAAIVDWGFNAWGGKYPPWDDDDRVPAEIAKQLKLPVFYPWHPRGRGYQPVSGGAKHGREGVPNRGISRLGSLARATVIMEGGAVDFNGAGTVLTTTDCLLNKNRNPHLSKEQIEQYLKDYYGQKHVCWLTGGIAGDDTDGHVDDLARFISPTKIVIGLEDDPKDENYRVLKSARKQLEKLRDQAGRPFEIVEIPMPGVVEHDGQRLPATYVNFYFVNGALLVPTYRHKKNDKRALAILQKQLQSRKVVGIDCTQLIRGLGAIHCLTQQQPRI